MIEDQDTYKEKFRLFENAWRNVLKDEKLPFYTVQIAPYLYSSRKDPKKHAPDLLAKFWEAQTNCLSLKNTYMVVTTDLVDKLTDIHPSYKWVVAHRLALQALAKTYNNKSIVYAGPQYKSMKKKKDQIILSFTNTGTGLASRDDKPLTWFTIAGEDQHFVPANVTIDGEKLIVSSPEIKQPTYVRFAWDETAQPNFINKEGLPAVPFRTDNLKNN
jgi:sialate O-acetylesterase